MSHSKHMMNTILVVIFTALLIPGLASAAAQATMKFTFDVTFDEGPLDGDTFTGSFTLNGFTGSGLEVFLPPGSSEPGGTGKLLAFEIEVDGNVFTMRDDVEFRDLPMIEAEDGMISYMDYGGVSNTGVRLRLDGSPGIEEPAIVWYEDDLGTKSFGYWNNVQVVGENPRHMQLNAIGDSAIAARNPRGNVTINQHGHVFNYSVSKLPTRDIWDGDGRSIYSIYMWTPTLGRFRIQNFNTSLGGTHSSVRVLLGDNVAAAVRTDPLCVEVWHERDDGLDGPDNAFSDYPVLRGETEEGTCELIK